MKTKKIWKNKYEMMNAELRNCRRVLTFMKKEIKDTKGEIGRKMLGKQLGRNLTLKKEIIIS